MLVPLEKPSRGISFSTEKERREAYFEFRKSPKGAKLEQAMRKDFLRCGETRTKAENAEFKLRGSTEAFIKAINKPEFKCPEQQHDIKLVEDSSEKMTKWVESWGN